jgi:hypothetical protein
VCVVGDLLLVLVSRSKGEDVQAGDPRNTGIAAVEIITESSREGLNTQWSSYFRCQR